jgi:pimeloyl-ACP methyl ester carboxylesterase
MAGRTTAEPLAQVLRAAGWNVTVAGVGRNTGPAYHGIDATEADLFDLSDRHGRRVRMIGHSRGGQFARVLAVRHPERVEQVVAVGAPLMVKYPTFVVVKVPAELLDRAWRAGAFGPVDTTREQAVDDDRHLPFPDNVDFVSIWSKTDGIVDWRMSLDPEAHGLEASASHLGLISSVAGINAIATALGRGHR